MAQRRHFQRFVRRGRPPWHELPDAAVLVVAEPRGMQIDNDLFLPYGAAVPRDRFQEYQLRQLYDWKRIDVASAVEAPASDPSKPEPEPVPDLPGAVINSRGPVKAPVRREAHPAR